MACSAIAKVIIVGGPADTHKKAEYSVVKKAASRVFSAIPGVSPTAFLGLLDTSGLTAYWGLADVLKLQAGETLIVSGAAGAVGNVTVQLAKHLFGAKKVIAIVRSNDKAKYVKSIGADVALYYKSPQFEEELAEATPEYSETFFDNVGGSILNLVLTLMAASRPVVPFPNNLKNNGEIITNRLELKGFIFLDYLHRPEGLQALVSALREGKLVLTGGKTIVEVSGMEGVPQVWYELFEGRNQVKLVTKLP